MTTRKLCIARNETSAVGCVPTNHARFRDDVDVVRVPITSDGEPVSNQVLGVKFFYDPCPHFAL